MSTRSRIGMEIMAKDGIVEILHVYCHSDGYLSHNGRILSENYNTPEKVKELIEHGEISFLDTTIGEKHSYGENDKGTTFFDRDLNNEWEAVKPEKTFRFDFTCSYYPYYYLFTLDGKWTYKYQPFKDTPVAEFKPLTEENTLE